MGGQSSVTLKVPCKEKVLLTWIIPGESVHEVRLASPVLAGNGYHHQGFAQLCHLLENLLNYVQAVLGVRVNQALWSVKDGCHGVCCCTWNVDTIGKPHECVEQLILSDQVCLWGLISYKSWARVWYEAPQMRSDTISCSTHKCAFTFIIHCI